MSNQRDKARAVKRGGKCRFVTLDFAAAEQRYGALPLADFDQGSLQDFPFTGYLGSTQWVRTHPDTVAAFLRALNEGQQLADTDRAAVESAMEQYTDVPPVIADTMAIDSYPLEMDVAQLQRVAGGQYLGQVRGDLAVIQPLDGQLEPGRAGGRGDGVAALGGVAVLGGEPDVDVLAGQVAGPAGHVQDQGPGGGGLLAELGQLAGQPGQSPQYRCSRHGSP